MKVVLLCSDCFQDQGLHLDAKQIGILEGTVCPNCDSKEGHKLDASLIGELAKRFFVWGTLSRCEYGAAPRVQFNSSQPTTIATSPWFESDIRLIERTIAVGFFPNAPRLWMIGDVEPLLALREISTRSSVVDRILAGYPEAVLSEPETFYRIRKNPKRPADPAEYDSPEAPPTGTGRLESSHLSVMYASQDLQVCVHECRVTAEDEVYVATLGPTAELRLLDLTVLLPEDDVTEFESLDMALHMLFLAGEHSYEISREIAKAARLAGYDGLVYPSYFSLLRSGGVPFETSLGISNRRLSNFCDREREKTIRNLALFGRPIDDGKVQVRCINKLVLNQVEYRFHFGPVGY